MQTTAVAAKEVRPGDTLCFEKPPMRCQVERVSKRDDGAIGVHALNDTLKLFYQPNVLVPVLNSTAIPAPSLSELHQRRVRACLKACEGIPTPRLEKCDGDMPVFSLLKQAMAEREVLAKLLLQCAELIELDRESLFALFKDPATGQLRTDGEQVAIGYLDDVLARIKTAVGEAPVAAAEAA